MNTLRVAIKLRRVRVDPLQGAFALRHDLRQAVSRSQAIVQANHRGTGGMQALRHHGRVILGQHAPVAPMNEQVNRGASLAGGIDIQLFCRVIAIGVGAETGFQGCTGPFTGLLVGGHLSVKISHRGLEPVLLQVCWIENKFVHCLFRLRRRQAIQ